MAVELHDLPGVGPLYMYKRRGVKQLRISIDAAGKIRLTLPAWATYTSAVRFAESRRDWILENIVLEQVRLAHGMRIGKAHRLVFTANSVAKPVSRIAGSEIRVSRPAGMSVLDSGFQNMAAKACIRALRLEAEALLPKRLRELGVKGGFNYNAISVKQLKGRWGSCDSKQNITLNLFLMQLPWQLIDYVLWHELTHTKHLNHGPEFWYEFQKHEPRAKAFRTDIKQYKPILQPVEPNRPAIHTNSNGTMA